MALIEYIEPISMGEIFLGIGVMILFFGVTSIFMRIYGKFCQWFELMINKEAKYAILEESFLDKIAKTKGINLEEELIRYRIIHDSKKPTDFRKKLEEQIYEDMFGKGKEK